MHSNYFFTILIVAVIFHLSSCSKTKETTNVEFYTHAITGLNNPNSYFFDNSPEGLEYALSFEGLDGIELDVQISADSTLWMFHDFDLSERTSGEGTICNKSDEYLAGVTINQGEMPITKFKDVGLSEVNGSKTIFIDVKYVGSCADDPISAQYLIQQCASFLSHPSIHVSFIINDPDLASEMSNLGYSIWKDEFSFEDINLSSTVYQGWFVRNSILSKDEVSTIKAAGKSVVLYEVFVPGSIKEAAQKEPTAVLVEDVKEAVILSE